MKAILILIILISFGTSKEDKKVPISFFGNKIIATSSLELVLDINRPSFLQIWKKNIATINPLLIPSIQEYLISFYKIEGFFKTKIKVEKGKKEIKVYIKENQHIKVGKILVKSDYKINSLILLKKGNRFREALFKQSKKQIKNKLLKNGYCSYILDSKAYIYPDKNLADITFNLKKGEICHFDEINFKGLSTIKDKLILSRLRFKKGDIFSSEAIMNTYQDLYRLECFDNVYIDYNRKIYNKIPVDITLKEISKNIIRRYGIGYSTKLQLQLKLYLEYRNFMGNGKKISLKSIISKLKQNYKIEFYSPATLELFDYYLDFQNTLEYIIERNVHLYDEKTFINKSFFSYNSSYFHYNLGLSFENINLSNDKNYLLIYPFLKMTYDSRNSRLNPTMGFYASSEIEYGLKYSKNSSNYLKYLNEFRAIYSIGDITFSAVGKFGLIKILENKFPESKKFFSGGSFSNRAYRFDALGITTSNIDTLSQGGIFYENLNLEANFPIYKSIRGAIFLDNTLILAEDQDLKLIFSKNTISSLGFGLRYLTPIGPIKIDFGANIKDIKQNAIHFQIGQSF